MYPDSLVCIVHGKQFFRAGFCFVRLSQPPQSQAHHKQAMLPIPLIQVFLKDQQIRQRYRKIIYLYLIAYMLFAIVYQFAESLYCLFFITKLSVRQPLIIDHFGRLIVVIHHAHRLRLSVAGFCQAV